MEPSLYLLPIYDEYIMGYKDRSAILEYSESLENIPSFKYDCMIVFNGQIIGTWKWTIKANSIELEYDFFTDINDIQKSLFEKAIEEMAQFYGLEIKYR
jgi:hypothetical protein